MKTYWTSAALLSTALWVGCGDRTPENGENFEQNQPGSPAEPAGEPRGEETAPGPTVSPRGDGSAATRPADAPGPRATTGNRPAPADVPPTRAATPPPAARSTAAPTAPAAPRWREVTVPAGTALPLELLTAVSSETAQIETPVRARLRQAVVVNGYTALPAGAVLSGTVIDVARAGRVQGRSRLALRFDEVEANGERDDLRTNPITFEGKATKGEDATKIGAGAVGGAIVGGIIGGGEGAAKGAAIGGAAGTGVVLATRGREVTLGAGTDLAATLATPFTVRAPAR